MSNGKLMKASAWAKREFEDGSIPDNRTIKRWVTIGEVRGKIVDGAAWVYSSEKWGVESDIASYVSDLIRAS